MKSAPEALRVRSFGQEADDLEVDFDLRPSPLLETELLTRCVRDGRGDTVGRDVFWRMELGRRIELLVRTACLDGPSELVIALQCPKCTQGLETELAVEEIADAQRRAEAEPPQPVLLAGECFTFRRPTGADQLAWLRQSYPDAAAATRCMAETLLEPDRRDRFREITCADEAWLLVVEEALEEADPLVRSTVTTACPSCGTAVSGPVDLAGIAIERMRIAQRELMETVHLLASRYHWSEQEIFAVPPWRRARYRAMLEA